MIDGIQQPDEFLVGLERQLFDPVRRLTLPVSLNKPTGMTLTFERVVDKVAGAARLKNGSLITMALRQAETREVWIACEEGKEAEFDAAYNHWFEKLTRGGRG